MIIGEVKTFPNVKPDKAQVLKLLEESAEVFSAWEDFNACCCSTSFDRDKWTCAKDCVDVKYMIDECADVIQAACNLIAALGIDDMRPFMRDCRERNEARGRYARD